MKHDRLRLFNLPLIEKILLMTNDEIYQFVLARFDEIVFNQTKKSRRYDTIGLHFAQISLEEFEKVFRRQLEEDDVNDLNLTLINDFCFESDEIALDFYGTGSFYDDAASCDAIHYSQIMPVLDEDSETDYCEKHFYLLEPPHLDAIITSLENNLAQLSEETRESIYRIKTMKDFCEQNKDYKAAFIYSR